MKIIKTIEERFREKLRAKDAATGCIEWTGLRLPSGYGQITINIKAVKTHRFAWQLKHGPIPEGMCVLHKCDNPACCNPDHLFLGTKADNNADRNSKGRSRPLKGEASNLSKMSEKDVAEVRLRLEAGETQRAIAASFEVNQASISRIKNGKTWKIPTA